MLEIDANKKKAKEALGEYFDNVIATLEKAKAKAGDLIEEVKQLRADYEAVVDVGRAKADIWVDFEERSRLISEEYEEYSSEPDMKKIWNLLMNLSELALFNDKFCSVLNVKISQELTLDNLKEAILLTIKTYQKDLKASQNTEKLVKFQDLSRDIKKFLSGKYSQKYASNLYVYIMKELGKAPWQHGEDILFIKKSLQWYQQIDVQQQLSKFFNSPKTPMTSLVSN